MYRLLGPDGFYFSPAKGTLGGNDCGKIYGRLDCPAALRAVACGETYGQHRVFFADEATAIAAGFRPCAACMLEAYRTWRALAWDGHRRASTSRRLSPLSFCSERERMQTRGRRRGSLLRVPSSGRSSQKISSRNWHRSFALSDGQRPVCLFRTASREIAAQTRVNNHKETGMLRLLLFTGAIFLVANKSFAQSPSPAQCQQLREAVAQYGYAAARRHALANYGPAAVEAGDQCFTEHSQRSHRVYDRDKRRAHRRHYRTLR